MTKGQYRLAESPYTHQISWNLFEGTVEVSDMAKVSLSGYLLMAIWGPL